MLLPIQKVGIDKYKEPWYYKYIKKNKTSSKKPLTGYCYQSYNGKGEETTQGYTKEWSI